MADNIITLHKKSSITEGLKNNVPPEYTQDKMLSHNDQFTFVAPKVPGLTTPVPEESNSICALYIVPEHPH